MSRLPTIIVPFSGPCLEENIQDVALYLRPDSNQLVIESTLLKVLHDSPDYKINYRVVYLANIPGDFIVENKILETHYNLQIQFAKEGKKLFTETMAQAFENYFKIPAAEAEIIGSFEALERLHLTSDELFSLWVSEADFFKIHEQSIKRYKDLFIVNYDIPAVLSKHNQSTNIFVMLLRSYLPYQKIRSLIDEMGSRLKAAGIIDHKMPISYVFHYSKGPFEQVLDGIGYIYHKDKNPIFFEDISFLTYLKKQGYPLDQVMQDLKNPIMKFKTAEGVVEKNLINYTHGDSFETAFLKYKSRLPISTLASPI